MSEVDVTGRVLSTFTDIQCPHHLSLDNEGHVLVADYDNHRILLLSRHLQLQCVLIDDTNSQVKLWQPRRLCYNGHMSQFCVVHNSSEERSPWSDVISLFILTDAEWQSNLITQFHFFSFLKLANILALDKNRCWSLLKHEFKVGYFLVGKKHMGHRWWWSLLKHEFKVGYLLTGSFSWRRNIWDRWWQPLLHA